MSAIVIDATGPMGTIEPGPLERALRRHEIVPTGTPDIFRFVKDHVGLAPVKIPLRQVKK
jgi:hypothetical protein